MEVSGLMVRVIPSTPLTEVCHGMLTEPNVVAATGRTTMFTEESLGCTSEDTWIYYLLAADASHARSFARVRDALTQQYAQVMSDKDHHI